MALTKPGEDEGGSGEDANGDDEGDEEEEEERDGSVEEMKKTQRKRFRTVGHQPAIRAATSPHRQCQPDGCRGPAQRRQPNPPPPTSGGILEAEPSQALPRHRTSTRWTFLSPDSPHRPRGCSSPPRASICTAPIGFTCRPSLRRDRYLYLNNIMLRAPPRCRMQRRKLRACGE